MAKVRDLDVGNVKGFDDLKKYSTILFRDIIEILNKGILFSDNFSGQIFEINFTNANSDVAIEHGLNRIPTGYIALSLSQPATLYNGGQTNNSDYIYLRSSAASIAKVMVF